MKDLFMIDTMCKYVVLFACTVFVGVCIYFKTDPPGWIVSLITMVFIYFFRRSPKKEVKNV